MHFQLLENLISL